MNCRKSETRERLLFYIEGELRDESERAQVERHLKECSVCREERHRYLKATRLLPTHQEPFAYFELPPFQMTETLQARIQGSWFNRLSNALKTIPQIMRRPAWGIPAIALVILLVGGAYLISMSEPIPNEELAARVKSQTIAGGYEMGHFQFGFGGLPLY